MSDYSSININVIVIVTNRSKTILKCLESILQNWDNQLSIKLYDFNSNDNSIDLVNKFLLDNNLDWSFDVLNLNLNECEDWQYCLERSQFGFVTFLEGDDYWPIDFVDKIKSIHLNNKSVGLIHFGGFNERKPALSDTQDMLISGSYYREEYLFHNFNKTYPPSQTVFLYDSITKKLEFDFKNYSYAPEPKFWMEISEYYDVYICNVVSVYRGISKNAGLKRQAIIDNYLFALELIKLNKSKKMVLAGEITYYLIRNYYLVYIKKLLNKLDKFELKVFVNGATLYFKTLKKILYA